MCVCVLAEPGDQPGGQQGSAGEHQRAGRADHQGRQQPDGQGAAPPAADQQAVGVALVTLIYGHISFGEEEQEEEEKRIWLP